MLSAGHYFLLARHKSLGSEARLPRQLLLLLLTLSTLIAVIVVSPLPESTRNQVLGLLGLVLSGVIALSAAPFVTNFMATVMLRVTKPFKVGDFIRVGEMYGKVSERGLFDTEIQTENRELIAIPNGTFINQPVTVVRSSGVIISTTVSLGYELGYSQVEPLMLQAAEDTGLSDPYIHIVALQDFSVSYKVCGLLADVQSALTARSELNRQLLNKLHDAGFEIASPTITRHISQSADTTIIPEASESGDSSERVKAEEIVFDKATETGRLSQERASLKEQIRELSERKSGDKQRKQDLHTALRAIEEQLKLLAEEP
ncbi:MAG: mechanosensitive ion channel [Halioglobus sp.]